MFFFDLLRTTKNTTSPTMTAAPQQITAIAHPGNESSGVSFPPGAFSFPPGGIRKKTFKTY